MKKYQLIIVLLLIIISVYTFMVIRPYKINIKTNFDSDIEEFDYNLILDQIFKKKEEVYNRENCYLIRHWTTMFNIDITNNKVIKDITISLAIEKKDMSYDIFQIRKVDDMLRINQVDHRKSFEELNGVISAHAVFDSLNNVNWDELFRIIPKGEYYTLRSWSVYRKGEDFDMKSGGYHSLSPRIAYIIKNNTIEQFNQEKKFTSDNILSVIVPMNNSGNGYQGTADIAVFITINE